MRSSVINLVECSVVMSCDKPKLALFFPLLYLFYFVFSSVCSCTGYTNRDFNDTQMIPHVNMRQRKKNIVS